MKLKISLILLGINIIILLLDFLFVNNMPNAIMYGSLIYVMVTTPIFLYLSLKGARERVENVK